MKKTISIFILAIVLFVPLFVTQGICGFDFWWWMSANLAFLLTLSLLLDHENLELLRNDVINNPLRKIVWGLLCAVLLYFVFLAGNSLSRIIFPFAARGINHVYGFRSQAPVARIVILMLLLIGPGEELFWRGMLQRRMQIHLSPWTGMIVTTLGYILIHAVSGNVMLVLAAGVCGLFWGWLYMQYRSILLNAVSHTAWDLLIFVLLPVG